MEPCSVIWSRSHILWRRCSVHDAKSMEKAHITYEDPYQGGTSIHPYQKLCRHPWKAFYCIQMSYRPSKQRTQVLMRSIAGGLADGACMTRISLVGITSHHRHELQHVSLEHGHNGSMAMETEDSIVPLPQLGSRVVGHAEKTPSGVAEEQIQPIFFFMLHLPTRQYLR